MQHIEEQVAVRKYKRGGRKVKAHTRQKPYIPTGRFGGYFNPNIAGGAYNVYLNYDEDPLTTVIGTEGRIHQDVCFMTLEETVEIAESMNGLTPEELLALLVRDGHERTELTNAVINWAPRPGMVMAYKKAAVS